MKYKQIMEILKTILPDELVRFRLEFDDEMKLSLNKVWSWWNGTQWVRKAAAELWHWDIERLLASSRKIPIIKEKVDIYFKYYFSTWDSWGKRQLDSSNCVTMSKMIEDSIRYHKTKNPKGILVDDTNVQVWWVNNLSYEMTLAERKLLETSYVEVSIRRHNPNL